MFNEIANAAKQDFKKNLDEKYDAAIQAHAFQCTDCKRPFITTYRAFEFVTKCPYCGEENLETPAQMKGIHIIVCH